ARASWAPPIAAMTAPETYRGAAPQPEMTPDIEAPATTARVQYTVSTVAAPRPAATPARMPRDRAVRTTNTPIAPSGIAMPRPAARPYRAAPASESMAIRWPTLVRGSADSAAEA